MVVSLSVLALQYSDDWLVCHPLTLLPPPPPPELMKVLKMDGELLKNTPFGLGQG